ncbi:MAG TPA: winged helix DNA-binding domain-containing protein [Actinomycetota bacterium]|nr:winged helix DNA-binding domain-containing protein [Actinomycetota bacterium]
MTSSLTWEQVRAFRLGRQSLTVRRPPSEMLSVAGELCGLHAQLMSSAELTVWARVEDLRPDAVRWALWEERTLVKTWAMRGTLHLLPSSEYWMWQAALSTYGHYLKPSWLKFFGATREDLDRLIEAVGQALDGRLLTRQELADAVAESTGSPDLAAKLLHSWGSMLKPPCFKGKLCFGPSSGQNVRFTSPEWWLGGRADVDPERAVDEVSRRFLASHGPATRDDYGRWWAVSPAQALARIRRLGDEAVEVDVEGTRCWMLAAHLSEAEAATAPGTVNLVPAFDQYVIAATRQAEHLMPGPFKGRIYRPQGWISPVLLVDGRMDGVWSHERKGSRVAVKLEPFVPLTSEAEANAEREASRLAGFLDCDRCEFSVVRD